MGRALLAPVLAAFRVQYPAVRVQVRLKQALVELVRDEVDLRLGRAASGLSDKFFNIVETTG